MSHIKEWLLNLVLDFLKDTELEKRQKEELSKWFVDFIDRQFEDFESSSLNKKLDHQSLFDYVIEGLRDEMQTYLLAQQEDREEASAGKTLYLRSIFLYKNEEDRILYLRAAALLKNGG